MDELWTTTSSVSQKLFQHFFQIGFWKNGGPLRIFTASLNTSVYSIHYGILHFILYKYSPLNIAFCSFCDVLLLDFPLGGRGPPVFLWLMELNRAVAHLFKRAGPGSERSHREDARISLQNICSPTSFSPPPPHLSSVCWDLSSLFLHLFSCSLVHSLHPSSTFLSHGETLLSLSFV